MAPGVRSRCGMYLFLRPSRPSDGCCREKLSGHPPGKASYTWCLPPICRAASATGAGHRFGVTALAKALIQTNQKDAARKELEYLENHLDDVQAKGEVDVLLREL